MALYFKVGTEIHTRNNKSMSRWSFYGEIR